MSDHFGTLCIKGLKSNIKIFWYEILILEDFKWDFKFLVNIFNVLTKVLNQKVPVNPLKIQVSTKLKRLIQMTGISVDNKKKIQFKSADHTSLPKKFTWVLYHKISYRSIRP